MIFKRGDLVAWKRGAEWRVGTVIWSEPTGAVWVQPAGSEIPGTRLLSHVTQLYPCRIRPPETAG